MKRLQCLLLLVLLPMRASGLACSESPSGQQNCDKLVARDANTGAANALNVYPNASVSGGSACTNTSSLTLQDTDDTAGELFSMCVNGLTPLTLDGTTGNVTLGSDLTANGGDATLSSTAPMLTLSDTTASAKDLIVSLDANVADIREAAGAAGSLVTLDLANNRVGIGDSTPDLTLDVEGATITASSGDIPTVGSLVTFTPSGAATTTVHGLRATVNISGAQNTSGIFRGVSAIVNNTNTGTHSGQMWGNLTNLNNNATSGTVGAMFGQYATVRNGGAGTTSDARGLYVDVQQNAGTITNAYGAYIGAIGGSNTWGVYQVAGAGKNYLASPLGIADGTPEAWAEIDGDSTDQYLMVTNSTDGDVFLIDENENVVVGSTGYFSAQKTSAGAPAAGDCDAAAEQGRIVVDTTNDLLYVCNNGSGRGWDSIALTD